MSVSKRDLHRLINDLSDNDTGFVFRLLQLLVNQSPSRSSADQWAEILSDPPMDDEPLTRAERTTVAEAKKAIADGQVEPWEQVKRELRL